FARLWGHRRYSVGARSLGTTADALSAHKRALTATLASVTPTESPVGGTARIVLPTNERLAESGVLKRGSPSAEAIDYVVVTSARDLETMAAAVQKRNVFDEVHVERSAAIGDPPLGGEDFILWFYQPAPAAGQWFLLEGSTKNRREVPLDLSKPVGPERVNAWLGALERAARKMTPESKR